MLIEKGTLADGVVNDGKIFREFELSEEVFKHTFELMNDEDIDRKLLEAPAYYSAALMAKRLTITGIKKVSPEMVQELTPTDGNFLLRTSALLDQRRAEFRKSIETAPQGSAGADKTGLPDGGDPADGHGGSPGDTGSGDRTTG